MSDWTCASLPSRRRGATVCVALAEVGRRGELRQLGVFENGSELLMKLAARLSKRNRGLNFCYEAGICSYGGCTDCLYGADVVKV